MCSGCSGYYEGDDGDQDAGDDAHSEGAGRQEVRWPAQEHESRWRRGDAASGRGGTWEARSELGRGAAGNGDDYEISVSAECIIERHTIRVNRHAASQRTVEEREGSWEESQRERERSLSVSANSYQTRRQLGLERATGGGADCRCLMLWGLAGATALGLALWLAIR